MEGQSQAINIPSRGDIRTGDPANFVGSPEPFQGSIPSQSSTPRARQFAQHGITISPTRPGFPRTVSTPHATRSRSTISTSVSDVTQGLFGLGNRERGREREWSVFGQLMAGDDDRRGYSSASPRLRGGERNRNGASRSRSRTSRSPQADRRVSYLEDSIHSSTTEHHLSASWNDRSLLASTTGPNGSTIEEDSEEDSDTEYEPTVRLESPPPSWLPFAAKLPTLTPLQRNILKCSVAYFLGSLFTFSPYLSGFLADLTNYGTGDKSPSPVGHIVATVYVFFSSSLVSYLLKLPFVRTVYYSTLR